MPRDVITCPCFNRRQTKLVKEAPGGYDKNKLPGGIIVSTVECPYNVVQYNIILYTAL